MSREILEPPKKVSKLSFIWIVSNQKGGTSVMTSPSFFTWNLILYAARRLRAKRPTLRFRGILIGNVSDFIEKILLFLFGLITYRKEILFRTTFSLPSYRILNNRFLLQNLLIIREFITSILFKYYILLILLISLKTIPNINNTNGAANIVANLSK